MRCDDPLKPRQQLAICSSVSTPLCIPYIQMWELQVERGCLDRIQTAVISDDVMLVLPQSAMISKSSQVLSETRVIGYYSTAVTARAKVFSWIETEACDVAHRPGSAATVPCSMRLSGIFNNLQI